MFTVCPKCALTLVVTAADLRVAQGYVRCGRCLNVFNALTRLSEERPAAASEPPTDTPTAASLEQAPSPAAAPAEAPAPPEPPAQASTLDDTGEIEVELDGSILVTASRPPVAEEKVEEAETPPLSDDTAGTVADPGQAASAVTPLVEAKPAPP